MMIIPPEKFATSSITSSPWGDQICRLLSEAIDAADAGRFVERNVSLVSNDLIIQSERCDLTAFEHIYVIGAGKAVMPMAEEVIQILGTRITSGLIITKEGYTTENSLLERHRVKVIEGAHPIPAQRNVTATLEILSLVSSLSRNDLVICLISGGGSSLLVNPAEGITLNDLQVATALLLKSGASIEEINTVRKHLDRIKGGKLARHLYPATVITLVLSDVIGDNLDLIASGPTVPDSSSFYDAWKVLSRYQLLDRLPVNVESYLSAKLDETRPGTKKSDQKIFENVHNVLVGNNDMVVDEVYKSAPSFGFRCQRLPIQLQGEASRVGHTLTEYIHSISVAEQASNQPTCYITGGETIVAVHNDGLGGRNQELVLGAASALHSNRHVLLVSLATDGGDGPTDAAGAVATNTTYERGVELGMHPDDYLAANDAYHYFERLGDLIRIGPTLTNVNDLVFIFIG